ncbi:hypothetical protein Lser_V15G10676 [Lactuca serriola]
MSQIFYKIRGKPFNGSRIRALLNHQNPQPMIPHLLNHPEPNTKTLFPESSSENKSTHFIRFHVYPSFSFEHFLNPISSTGLPNSKPEEDPELDGSSLSNDIIRADSVKKKRKKKMNKHKLKKLKKRLRHCS